MKDKYTMNLEKRTSDMNLSSEWSNMKKCRPKLKQTIQMDLKWSNMKLCGPQVAFKIDLKRTSKNLSEPKKIQKWTSENNRQSAKGPQNRPQNEPQMDLKLTFLQFSTYGISFE